MSAVSDPLTASMFTGLSAFPLTSLHGDRLDEAAFAGLVDRLRDAVDSITALGSTGSYAYFDRDERKRAAAIATRHAGDVPVIVGVGALRASQVLALAVDAQTAGASGVLLAPVSYQALTDDDVIGLLETLTAKLSAPIVVYDNPGTTHLTLTDDLYARIAVLPNVASVKIPGISTLPADASARVATIREHLPAGARVGVSGDAFAASGLIAGCDAWYSVMAARQAVYSDMLEEPSSALSEWHERALWPALERLRALNVIHNNETVRRSRPSVTPDDAAE